jgi:hypothetical protein
MEESLGNPNAVNKLEQAYGIAQIRQIRLDDYNMRTGKKYKLKDCFNQRISKEIFMYYAHRYSHHDMSYIARKWNGSGKETYRYWKRVNARL